ncbi:hypothetical protein CRG98_042523 [Punica granatum]|uniref:NAC domain-containing protein n=1 Tax=Punica granatum TaxID=22663 RepID=A0A2I0HZF4_PUNGR|nr:hypothetical protein CRG98_042523 [Punica granatum]
MELGARTATTSRPHLHLHHHGQWEWVMHEYRLIPTPHIAAAGCSSNSSILDNKQQLQKLDKWVICRIFKSKPSSRGSSRVVPETVRRQRVGGDVIWISGGGGGGSRRRGLPSYSNYCYYYSSSASSCSLNCSSVTDEVSPTISTNDWEPAEEEITSSG